MKFLNALLYLREVHAHLCANSLDPLTLAACVRAQMQEAKESPQYSRCRVTGKTSCVSPARDPLLLKFSLSFFYS